MKIEKIENFVIFENFCDFYKLELLNYLKFSVPVQRVEIQAAQNVDLPQREGEKLTRINLNKKF